MSLMIGLTPVLASDRGCWLTTLACFWLVLLVTLQFALFPSFVGMSTWRSSRFLPAQGSAVTSSWVLFPYSAQCLS